MIAERILLHVLLATSLTLGGCAAPRVTNGEGTPGDTTPTPSEAASTEPLVLPDERDTHARRSESPGPGHHGETNPRIAPEDLENVDRARELARRGHRAFEKGNTKHALELFRRASDHDPDNVAILSNIGSLHYRLGNYRSAVQAYRSALRVDAEDYFSHFYAGVAYYRLGETVRARRHLQRALELRPDSREARDWLERVSPAAGSGD